MFGAVDAGLLFETMKRDGWMEQLEFDFPPCIYIEKEKLTSVPMGFSWNRSGSIYSQDHPAFTSLRNRLEKEGYIKTERSWLNGDRVTKPFYLNNMYFEIGERFSSAPALGVTYDIALRKETSSPAYGGVSERPFRPKKDTKSSEGDSETSVSVSETLPLDL